MDVFDKCIEINDLINIYDEFSARNELIKLLAFWKRMKSRITH